jgi:mRNA interferase RelE/StbE
VSPSERYVVQYDPTALKELSKLDKSVVGRITKTMITLADDPRPAGSRSLTGHPGLLRIRVGDYRVVYMIRDAELVVLTLRVAHRSRVYRNL